ncbi:hypothetical protein [Arthrobacter sp. H35-D1]|uniref:hypothetical protein n=1 Tax=Arthrobacter sp. H35-D1 TaxID=3046202 RepID=UPI0024B8A080|nr:hypothetical protein [Arthrobacter sp. H35-D1]MDJ0315462.1 hypothetical protein [Arthrobacter sp. H35-D1]
MDAQGFDVLTRRKGNTSDIEAKLFTEVSHTDEHGEVKTRSVADTLIDLPLDTTKNTGEVFGIRQINRIVVATGGGTRQIHVLTTDKGLSAGEVVYRLGKRWRQENQFRYVRMNFELNSLDSYTSTDDNADRMVPNPAKAESYQKVVAATNHHGEAGAVADHNLLALKTPAEGTAKSRSPVPCTTMPWRRSERQRQP